MAVEILILVQEQAVSEFVGHGVGRRKTPLLVGRDGSAEQPSVGRLEHGGVVFPEQWRPVRQQQQDNQGQCRHHEEP